MVNVGKYTIHGLYGIACFSEFFRRCCEVSPNGRYIAAGSDDARKTAGGCGVSFFVSGPIPSMELDGSDLFPFLTWMIFSFKILKTNHLGVSTLMLTAPFCK